MNLSKIFSLEGKKKETDTLVLIKENLSKKEIELPKNFKFVDVDRKSVPKLNDFANEVHNFLIEESKFDSNPKYKKEISNTPKEKYIDVAMDFIKSCCKNFFILDDKNEFAAYVGIKKSKKLKEIGAVSVRVLFVRKDLRGKHLGTACLMKAENIAVGDKYKKLLIRVYSNNNVAKNLYIKYGFKESEE